MRSELSHFCSFICTMRVKISLITAAICLAPQLAAFAATTLHVANNGIDSALCGGAESPCRTISRAISNASAGDEIAVGPGRYGDLNGNGSFNDPGDEAAEVAFPGCICMIKINKSVSIHSTDGAASTVLDAGGADIRVVSIQSNDVAFGLRYGGFTILNARREGVFTEGSLTGFTLEGNLASQTGTNGNDAFYVSGTGLKVRGNVAINNARGGFTIVGTADVTENVSSGNLQGFWLIHSGSFQNNFASANRTIGIDISGAPGLRVERNGILGNGGVGIRISVPESIAATISVAENNVFGNLSQCGIFSSVTMFVAPFNYWGASSGPGADPADLPCVQDPQQHTLVVSPFATKPFSVKSYK